MLRRSFNSRGGKAEEVCNSGGGQALEGLQLKRCRISRGAARLAQGASQPWVVKPQDALEGLQLKRC